MHLLTPRSLATSCLSRVSARCSVVDSSSDAGVSRSASPILTASAALTSSPSIVIRLACAGTDQPEQPIEATNVIVHAEADLRNPEERAFSRHSEIATGGQPDPPSNRRAVDRCDRHLRQPLQPGYHVLPVLLIEAFDLLRRTIERAPPLRTDVHSRAERGARPCHDHYLQMDLSVKSFDCIRQRDEHLAIQGVAVRRTVERERGDRSVSFHSDDAVSETGCLLVLQSRRPHEWTITHGD